MSSASKKAKTDKRNHPGRDGKFLKKNNHHVKGVSFYNKSERASLNHDVDE